MVAIRHCSKQSISILKRFILTNRCRAAKSDDYLRVVPVTFLCVILSSPKRVFACIVVSRSYDIANKTVAPRWHRSTQCTPFRIDHMYMMS